MAVKCPRCRSTETQTLIHNNQCLTCGGLFNFDGSEAEPGFSESTRAAVEASLRPRATVVVGNYADLQRMGAQAATDDKREDFKLAPQAAPTEIITPAEQDARQGIATVNATPDKVGDELTTSGSVQTGRKRASSRK